MSACGWTSTDVPVQELIMADLVDALIQERLFGFGEPAPPSSNGGERWLSVRCGAGSVVRVRVRGATALQPYRFARGPVLCGSRELAPDELLRLLAGDGAPCAAQVCADLRAAGEHARATLAARHDLVPGPGELLAGERLTATRGRPFHPTARAAAGWTADELSRYGPMRREPLGLDWLAVRRDRVCLGSGAGGDRLAALLLDARDAAALGARADALDGERCLLPVHPWQAEHVLPAAFGAELRSGCMRFVGRGVGRFAPTASLRTLAAPDPAVHVKLPLAIATLGATRLLPPRYLRNGERAEELMRALVQRDPVLRRRVALCDERTWCGWKEEELAPGAGQLAAQLRRYPRDVLEQPGTVTVAMAALAAHEWEALGPAILGGLHPVSFFAQLARAFAETALSFLRYGVLPELHGQNVVVVLRDGAAGRFVLRDHDTLRLYEPWMRAAGVADPGYRIRPGAAQSLVLDRGEDLVGYLQTLGLQVNLFAIADALGRHHGIAEDVFWEQQRIAVTCCLRDLDLPAATEGVVREQLLRAPTWPSRQILGPLLAQGSSAGVSMPAATGAVRNPLLCEVR
jgi:siderophore synthetase component